MCSYAPKNLGFSYEFEPVFGVELAMMRFQFRKLEQGSTERSSKMYLQKPPK